MTRIQDDEIRLDLQRVRAFGGESIGSASELFPAGFNRGYRPKTVNVDGWADTRNAFQAWFPAIAAVLCFLHGFLRIRDRCRKAHELHGRVWEVSRATTAEKIRRRMGELQLWCATRTWTAPVREMLEKLWSKNGHQGSPESRRRGWALLVNFRPYAPRGK